MPVGNVAWLPIEQKIHLQEALQFALRSYENDPMDSNKVSNVAYAYYLLNDFALAENYFEESILGTECGKQKGEWIGWTYAYLGPTYEKLGKRDKALQAFRTALERYPTQKEAIEALKQLGG